MTRLELFRYWLALDRWACEQITACTIIALSLKDIRGATIDPSREILDLPKPDGRVQFERGICDRRADGSIETAVQIKRTGGAR